MHGITRNKAQMLIDTVQSYGSLMLSVVAKEGVGRAPPTAQGAHSSLTTRCKTNAEPHFCFPPLFVHLGLLSISENRY